MAINETADRRVSERRFFLAIAILFPLIALIGFAPTYYLKPLFNTPPIPRVIIHLHGIVMAAWIALFVAQVYLIRSMRIKVHQRLGLFSIVLAVLVVATGLPTAIAATKFGSPSLPSNVDRLEFLVVPIFDLVGFVILFAAAVYYRRNAANHKRLMLLTVLNFLPPALARFPFGLMETYGPLWFFGLPDVIAIGVVIADTWRNRKLNKVFLAGTIFLIASHWLRLPLSTTSAWLSFARWLTGM